jgi:hypothetical protein
VQILETPLGNEYLNATLLPTLPPEGTYSLLDNDTKRDTLPPLPNNNSQPELSVTPAAIALKRNSSSGPGLRQTSLNASAMKRRHAGIGAASPHGRLFKVLGDFFLLAGKTEDAVIWYLAMCLKMNPLISCENSQVHRSYCLVQNATGFDMARLCVGRDSNCFCA